MRAVVLSQWFPPEKAAIPADIAAGLAAAGHAVTVLTGFPNYPTGKIYEGWRQRPWTNEAADGYRLRRVALYPSHDRSPARRAAGYFSFAATSTAFGWSVLRSADVVYVYHPPLTSVLGPWLSRTLRGAPYVLHVQDLWPDSVLSSGMVEERTLAAANRAIGAACEAVYRRASSIIAIAPTMAEMLKARGVPNDRLHVVPNWADESIFSPIQRDPQTAEELGLSEKFSVMFAGNVGVLQGLDVAIRAAATLSDLPEFQLVIVGDGVALSRLRGLAKELRTKNVKFVPPKPLSEMNDVASAADVQLVCLQDLPFFKGTIPSKLSAVLASGLPIICTVAGDARRIVEDAGAGWTCNPGDVDALARTFRIAHTSSAKIRATLGVAARSYYQKQMGRDVNVSRIEQIMAAASRLAK